MDLERNWERALQKTEIIRPRIQPLSSAESTMLPYILLSETGGGSPDTFVRKGRVLVEKPALILPPNNPQWEGFDWSSEKRREADGLLNFLLVRGVQFPSMRYNNQTESFSVYDGGLNEASEHFKKSLQKEENLSAGLVLGPEDCWQFSVLVFICSQVLKSADGDIRTLLDNYRRKHSDL